MQTEIDENFHETHREIDTDQWENIYVVGDVHGCTEEFRELIEKINLKPDELLVCVGDLIRKGPDTVGAVEIVRNHDNIISVLGNGEFDFLRSEKSAPSLTELHREFIESWPLVISWPGNLVIHGGIDPERRIAEHDAEDIVNMRSPKNNNSYESPFWFEEYDRSTRIFFGHTATRDPIFTGNAVGLDTGCVYGGKLTAYDTSSKSFMDVPARRTYESRRESKYADQV